jgi:hypothetical protein
MAGISFSSRPPDSVQKVNIRIRILAVLNAVARVLVAIKTR